MDLSSFDENSSYFWSAEMQKKITSLMKMIMNSYKKQMWPVSEGLGLITFSFYMHIFV